MDAALAYAKKDWAVLPLAGKLPRISKAAGGCGVHDATTDTTQITKWWTSWPQANIGIACGQSSGFWVLDVDPRHDGDESLEKLLHEHGALPATVEQFTGGGGRHILFKYTNDPIRNRVNIAPGIDIRGDGGYIVVAPSLHPDTKKPYTWDINHHPNDVKLAPAPTWLIELVSGNGRNGTAAPRRGDSESPPAPSLPNHGDLADRFIAAGSQIGDPAAYGAAALAEEAQTIREAAPGQQEATLNTAALKIGGLVAGGALNMAPAGRHQSLVASGTLNLDDARAALVSAGMDMANEQGRPPWTRDQIETKVDRGLRDGMAQPRHLGGGVERNTTSTPSDGDPRSPPTSSNNPTRLKPILWADLGTLPRRTYLIKRLIDTTAFAVIYGESNCGKTFLALDLALHVSLGQDWFGRKVRQGAVLYIAAEGGLGIEERLTAFRNHHDIDPANVPFAVLPTAINLCAAKGDTSDLITEIKRLADMQPVNLVAVDTLSRVMAGYNENAPEDMTAFVANCDRIRAETKSHVLVVHHSGKDTARGARGHSALRAATDTEIEVVKIGSSITATVTKQRDQPGGDAFTFRLEPVEIGMDDEEDIITSCVVVPVDHAATATRARPSGQAKIAFELLVKAIEEEGEIPPPCRHIPTGTKRVVPLSLWRRYVYAGSVTERDNPDANRKAFLRVANKLQSLEIIGVWDELVWINQ